MRESSSSSRGKRLPRLLALGLGLLLFSLPCTPACGQEAGYPFIYYPSPLAEHAWQVSVGFTLVQPPKEFTEEIRIGAPAFDGHALYGLPSHFALDGRAIAQVVQNHFSLGARWTYPLGDFAVGAGYDVAFWFGFLNVEGFDTRANGWMNYPSVTVGYNTGEVRLILKAEAILDLRHRTSAGDNEISSDTDRLAGGSYMFAIEQPFWGSTHLTLGFRATYTKFDWMTWSFFSTFDRYLFHPEIIVGFIL